PSLTCGVWVGFDDHRSLGDKEEGSHVALPIWMQFMEEVLKNRRTENFPYSPLLQRPEQVKEILAGSAPESLLAQRSALPSPSAAAPNAPESAGNQPRVTNPSEGRPVSPATAKPNGGPSSPPHSGPAPDQALAPKPASLEVQGPPPD